MDPLMVEIEKTFDPTDANSAQDLAYRCLVLMKVCARALWVNDHNLRMGRDESRDMGVAVHEAARCLGLPVATAQEANDLYKQLHGITSDEASHLQHGHSTG